jgi:ssDNA-binding Zn-finger/Zn-ribbon topoisomerase 1
MVGTGEPCPTCGATDGGALVAKRGRFGPFVGCNRYPSCSYIKKDGPPPPPQLPFEVACPACREGHFVARRARRTSSVFWGCSRYPKCNATTSREPLGPVHDPDGGPLVRADGDAALCLGCGATVPLAGEALDPGRAIAGGTADPAALLRPARGGRGAAKGRPSGSAGRARRTAAPRPRAARPA